MNNQGQDNQRDNQQNNKKQSSQLKLLTQTLSGSLANYVQVWASFGIAGTVCGAGIYFLDMEMERKGFLGMGYLFMTASAFTLAKTIRDRDEADKIEQLTKEGILNPKDTGLMIESLRGTPAWLFQVATAFVVSAGVCAFGLHKMPFSLERKAFFGMGALFLIGSTFNLAKTVRDRADAAKWLKLLK